MATAPRSKENVRGAGRPTAGASDTTMLIWQTIEKAGEEGITRQQLFERLEERIPAGYAMRRFRHQLKVGVNEAAPTFSKRARSYVLTSLLFDMRRYGLIVRRRDKTFGVLRKPRYLGDEQKIDVDGDIATRHMAVAEALRVLRQAVARNRKWVGTKRMHGHLTGAELAALEALLASFS